MQDAMENSSKPDETKNAQVFALDIAGQWAREEGGGNRKGHLIETVIAATRDAVARGEDPPEKDSVTLDAIWQQEGGAAAAHASPLRGSEVSDWWSSRHEGLRQRLRDARVDWEPTLEVIKGGGRGNPKRYRIKLLPLSVVAAEAEEDDAAPESTDSLVYRIDPAKPAFWLRLLLGSKPFPVASWRGYILLGSAILNILLIALLWWALYTRWASPRQVTTADIAGLVTTAMVSAFLWWQTAPIRKLAEHRVTLAGVTYLGLNELFGQLRTMPESTGKDRRRIFSVVRHWGTCPVCAAEVDLDSGRNAFPDRLVGRCHDAPLEHVFSFDPVTLKGERLR